MSKTVPVVVYSKDGERTVVGEANVAISGDRVFISANITEPEYAKYFEGEVKQISMGNAMPKPNPYFKTE